MLRLGSQSLPNTKLSPKLLNAPFDCPISLMKKYASRARINAARVVNPHLRIRSGIRLTGDRSKLERPPGTVVLASTDPPLGDGRAVAGHRGKLRGVLGRQRGRQWRIRALAPARAERLLTGAEGVGQEILVASGRRVD